MSLIFFLVKYPTFSLSVSQSISLKKENAREKNNVDHMLIALHPNTQASHAFPTLASCCSLFFPKNAYSGLWKVLVWSLELILLRDWSSRNNWDGFYPEIIIQKHFQSLCFPCGGNASEINVVVSLLLTQTEWPELVHLLRLSKHIQLELQRHLFLLNQKNETAMWKVDQCANAISWCGQIYALIDRSFQKHTIITHQKTQDQTNLWVSMGKWDAG